MSDVRLQFDQGAQLVVRLEWLFGTKNPFGFCDKIVDDPAQPLWVQSRSNRARRFSLRSEAEIQRQ